MERTKEEMKKEAVKRMRMLKMLDQPIREFEEEDKLNYSEVMGILYWMDDKKNEVIQDFEKKSKSLVYHAVYSKTEFGDILTLLYVTEDDEEWELDREDLKGGYPVCYAANMTVPPYSEYGTCTIKPCNGGVIRTA